MSLGLADAVCKETVQVGPNPLVFSCLTPAA